MALEGSLADFGLADILQLIYFERKTGVLTLEGKTDKVSLLFIDGNISGAVSKRRMVDNHLGRILLRKGLIKEEVLEHALEEQRETGVKLGNILIRNGLVEKEVIQGIVQDQIAETVLQLFDWKQGIYEFAAQQVSTDKDMPFSLDTEHLLMEGLRMVDEWSVIQDRIALDSVFRKRTDTTAGLTEKETEVFACVDGKNNVSAIIDLSGQNNFEVSKTLLSLLEKGFIKTAETFPGIEEYPASEAKASSNIPGYLPYFAVILSLCLSLAGVFMQQSEDIKNFSTSKKINELRMKIETYHLEYSVYPPVLDQVTHSQDAWGRPFIYRPGADSFSIAGAGADGVEGTKDDIY